jgi:Sap, sulfolipid-1-addressing protein
MGAAIGDVLPLAIGIAISPVPIIAIILMLLTPQAKGNGLAFLCGWLLGLVVVGTIALVVANSAGVSTSTGPSETASVIRLLLGVLLLLAALRRWRARPQPGQEAPLPKWMEALDGFTPVKSFGAGALLSGVNPKNLVLNLAAAAGIAQAGLTGAEQAIVVAVLVVIGSLGIIAPVAVYFAMGENATHMLDGWKAWLAVHNAAVMVVLFLVFAMVLIGKGISGLS